LSLQQVKDEMSKVRGHLVDMPLDFLIVSLARPPGGAVTRTDLVGRRRNI
jgi:hypothetical protein